MTATNPTTGEQRSRAVTHLWVHRDHTIRLTAAHETLATTADHPFWNATDNGWQTADRLDVGDRVATAAGDPAAVQAISAQSSTTQVAYNLTVKATHTYHVGAQGALVHNTCRISKVAPAWATKGAHIHADGVELALRPGKDGSIVFKPVFGSTSQAAEARAIRQAEDALQNPAFREQLIRDVRRGRDYLADSELPGARAKSGELNFLLKHLQRAG